MTAARVAEAHFPLLSQPVKLQRLRPKTATAAGIANLAGEEIAEPQVVGW